MEKARHLLCIGLAALGGVASQGASAASTERVSLGLAEPNWSSEGAAVTPNGRFVAFVTAASNLVADDNNSRDDIFVRDRQEETTERISVASGGAEANSSSSEPSVSADGRFVAFVSRATNLVADDSNGDSDIFVRDRQRGTTKRISVDSSRAEADNFSTNPAISADGRFVAFYSYATNLIVGDGNGAADVFVHDRQDGTTVRVSVDSSGGEANDDSGDVAISADGRFVAFASDATDLVDGDMNGEDDIFVHDRQTGTTERVSVDSSGAEADGRNVYPAISTDGRFVGFESQATNLVAGDENGVEDIYLRDRQAGTTERISLPVSDPDTDSWSFNPSVSADGRFVAFESDATNIVDDDTNEDYDVFVRDRQSGTTERVSVDSAGAESNYTSGGAAISAGGRFVAFVSGADNLVADDTNFTEDIFLRDRGPQLTGRNDLAIDFGGRGLFQRLNNSVQQKIRDASPLALAAGDLDGSGTDEVIAAFSDSLRVRYDNATWLKTSKRAAVRLATGDLDGSGQDELIADFGARGLWVFYNNASWLRRNPSSTQGLTTGDLDGDGGDEIIAAFADGLWAFFDDTTWTKLLPITPVNIAAGDLDGNGKDEVAADLGADGLWVLHHDASWVQRHRSATEGLATGDLDGSGADELIADFGAAGLRALFDNVAWTRLRRTSPTNMVAGDFDDSGEDDLVIDLGTGGLRILYNNERWAKAGSRPTEGLATGSFD